MKNANTRSDKFISNMIYSFETANNSEINSQKPNLRDNYSIQLNLLFIDLFHTINIIYLL